MTFEKVADNRDVEVMYVDDRGCLVYLLLFSHFLLLLSITNSLHFNINVAYNVYVYENKVKRNVCFYIKFIEIKR